MHYLPHTVIIIVDASNLMRADIFIVEESGSGFIPFPGYIAAIGIASALVIMRKKK